MAAIAGYCADNALESASGDSDLCAIVELVFVGGYDYKTALLVG